MAVVAVLVAIGGALLNTLGGLPGGFLGLGLWALLGLFGLVSAAAGVGMARRPGSNKRRLLLVSLSLVPLLIALFGFAPLASAVNSAEFWLRKPARERAAERLLAEYGSHRKYFGPSFEVSLPEREEHLSEMGRVSLLRDGADEGVYFYTHQSLFRGGSGLVYATGQALPRAGEFDEFEQLADQWWWVSD